MTRGFGLWKPTFPDLNSRQADSQPQSPWVRRTDALSLGVFAHLGAHGKPSIKGYWFLLFPFKVPTSRDDFSASPRPPAPAQVNRGFSFRWLESKRVDLEAETLGWGIV